MSAHKKNPKKNASAPAISDLNPLEDLDGQTTVVVEDGPDAGTELQPEGTPAPETPVDTAAPEADADGMVTLESGLRILREDFLAIFKPESLKTIAADPELGKAMKAGIKTIPGASATKNEEVRVLAATIKWGEVTLAEHPQIGYINQFSVITKTGMTQVGVTWTDKNEDGGKNGFYVSHKKLTAEQIEARVEAAKIKALKQALAGLIEIN
jgi:hypothetical protein